MKRLRIRIILGILAAILVVGLIIYHIPQERQSTMWVCSTSGEPVKLEMDLKYYRRLFRLPTVKGTVSFNGIEYLDEESKYNTKDDDPGWGRPTGPDVLPRNMNFYQKNETGQSTIFRNQIRFINVSGKNNFDAVCFWYKGTNLKSGIRYFGPAQTPEEAKQIAAYFGYTID